MFQELIFAVLSLAGCSLALSQINNTSREPGNKAKQHVHVAIASFSDCNQDKKIPFLSPEIDIDNPVLPDIDPPQEMGDSSILVGRTIR